MRSVKPVLAVAICILLLGAFAVAGQNQLGVANLYKVTFEEKVKVADTVLPIGKYEIRHVMEGQNHIMVFRQIGAKTPVEVRVKCTMVPLPSTALQNERIYELNAANERVLRGLIFRGDKAKHAF